MTAEHVKQKSWDNDHEYYFVCAGCVNSLGFNVMWDRAEKVGHVLPSYSDLDQRIMDAFGSHPDLMGGLRVVYDLARAEQGEEVNR